MTAGFGSAKRLYADNVHPRVLMSAEDIARLKKAVKTGLGKKILAAMKAALLPVRDRVLADGNLVQTLSEWNKRWDNAGTSMIWGMHDLAVIGLLTDDDSAIEAVRRALVALPAAEQIVGRQTGMRLITRGMPFYAPLAYDLIHDRMSESDRAAFIKWAMDFFVKFTPEHLGPQYLRHAGGNIAMTYMLSALGGLLSIDGDAGVPDLSEPKKRFADMLAASLHTAIGPQGYPEEDGGYGYGMVGHMAFAVEGLRRAGIYDALSDCPRYARFGRAMLHFVQPWGQYLSNTGDHGDDFGKRTFVLSRLAEQTKDPTLTWLLETLFYPSSQAASKRGQGEVPVAKGFQVPADSFALLALDLLPKRVHPAKAAKAVPTAFCDTNRGLVSLRSGWDDDATFVVFDGSQRSPGALGHAHDSCGHFSMTALGEYFAIDTGRYNIEQNCHNVMLVDGKSGRSTDGEWRMTWYHGVLTDYRPGKMCDSASVDSSHQHDCYWARRHVGLVKGEGMPAYLWVADDVNKNHDCAEFWWQLHTSPENVIELRETSATITGWRKGNCMDVHFIVPFPASFPKPHTLSLSQDIATPSSYKYVGDVAAEAAKFERPSDMLHHCVWQRPRLLAKVAGYNGRIVTLCLPRRKGQAPAAVEHIKTHESVYAVRIAAGAVEDTFIFAHENNLLEAGDVSGRGQWCVVRRQKRTGKILSWDLGHGTRLSVGGKRLV